MNRPAATICTKSRDGRLAAYISAAGAVGVTLASESHAVVVGNNTVRPFGVNGVVNLDFNNDGQTDFQIDHDRFNLNGSILDYLQIDKNDVNGELNPLAFDPGPDTTFQATPFMDGATPRNDANESAYVISPNVQGSYPAALALGTPIGPQSSFDFQEGGNFQGGGKDIRANRLIDEDATQIDQVLGGQPVSGVQVPFNGPNFVGLGGATRYLGLKMDLNNAGVTNYGWVGIRIDNEADATGTVTGWAYESVQGMSIVAGDIRPAVNPDFNRDGQVDGADFLLWQRQLGSTVTAGTGSDGNSDAKIDGLDLIIWKGAFGSATAVVAGAGAVVPEPSSFLTALGSLLLFGCWMVKRWRVVHRTASRCAAR